LLLSLSTNRSRTTFSVAVVVALITLVVYLPALRNDFVTWDDDVNVYDNPHIRVLDWSFFQWAFTDISISYWQPVVWISHAVDYSLWGLNPLGHHLTNIVLHALNTFLVVMLVARLLEFGGSPAGGAPQLTPHYSPFTTHLSRFTLLAAGVAGLLFGIHPLHVESVAWITERKDLLSAVFSLLSALIYIRYASDQSASHPGEGRSGEWLRFISSRWYLLSFVLFLLALASKPMAVTLPVVYLLLDWYPFRRCRSLKRFVPLFAEKIPFLIFGAVAAAGVLLHKTPAEVISLTQLTLPDRVAVAASALLGYLRKMVVPLGLSPYYPDPDSVSLLSIEYGGALILVTSITVVCILLTRKYKLFVAVWVCYIVMVMPVLGIVKTKALTVADRFTYLPSLGPFLLAGLSIAWVWTKTDALGRSREIARFLAASLLAAVLLFLSYMTIQQIAVWKNSIIFWSHIIEKEPSRALVAYNNRGNAFKAQGQFELAIRDYSTLLGLDGNSTSAYNNRGLVYRELGQYDHAVADHTMAINLKPDLPYSYNNRALAYRDIGQYGSAIEDFNTAINLAPDYSDAYTNRGWTYQTMGETGLALTDYNRAIGLDPAGYTAFNNRGLIYLETGDLDAAIADLTRAVRINPFFAQSYVNRGLAYEAKGEFDRAVRDYTAAIKADPSFYSPRNNRGLLYKRMGRPEKALEDLNTAIELYPSGGDAYVNRGLVYEDLGQYRRAIEDYSRAIALRPDDHMTYYGRGLAYAKVGDAGHSVRDYQKACDLGGQAGCEAMRSRRER